MIEDTKTDIKTRIMQAAKAIAEEKTSVQGVMITLEAVAQRAGLSKPGLMYHYPTKDALMVGLVEYSALQWVELMRGQVNEAPEDLSAFDRYRAYVVTATTADISRADYWVFSDAAFHSTLSEPWKRILNPWFDLSSVRSVSAQTLLTAARFTADGAWMSEATGVFPAEDISAIRSYGDALIDQAEIEEGSV